MPQPPVMDYRPICDIASDIRKHWTKVNYAAKPYLDAMNELCYKDDKYICDDAKSIVIYFLSNASGFKGSEARRLKSELKNIFGIK